jgi:hypothetical protein
MSGVFLNIDPPPPHRPASVYPPPLVRGEDTLAGWRGGGGSIVRKIPDTALHSYIGGGPVLRPIICAERPQVLLSTFFSFFGLRMVVSVREKMARKMFLGLNVILCIYIYSTIRF